MNLYWKKKWVEALRSGVYIQGTGQLRKEDEFCCLGVLCDLTKERLMLEWEGENFDGEELVLPDSVQSFCELEDANPEIELENGVTTCLSIMNDNKYTFEQISDLIETQL